MKVQYSPKIMHAQEVARKKLLPRKRQKEVKLRFIRKKFKAQEVQNPTRKKPQEVENVSANRK